MKSINSDGVDGRSTKVNNPKQKMQCCYFLLRETNIERNLFFFIEKYIKVIKKH